MIPDGASLMIGGFMAVGSPERVGDEIVRQNKRDLVVIANDTAAPGFGIGKLITAKAVRRAAISILPFSAACRSISRVGSPIG